MKILNNIVELFSLPSLVLNKIRWVLTKNGYYNSWSDEKYLKYKYRLKLNKKLNLEAPTLYTEKLQWLKINDRNSLYTKMVDKYEAKGYIEDKVGKNYCVPTIGIYDNFEDINFDNLPNEFVLKCTHNSGGIIICKDKNKLDIEAAKKKVNGSLNYNHFYTGREWPYKNVKPRIIIEKLLKNDDCSDVVEYNLFCFDGIPKLIMTCHGDKRVKRYNDFYDINFNKLDLKCEDDNSDMVLVKPVYFDELIEISKKLSKNLPQLRVDLYVCNNKIYVGELTFFHWSGLCKFVPEIWDKKMGDWLNLPINKN